MIGTPGGEYYPLKGIQFSLGGRSAVMNGFYHISWETILFLSSPISGQTHNLYGGGKLSTPP